MELSKAKRKWANDKKNGVSHLYLDGIYDPQEYTMISFKVNIRNGDTSPIRPGHDEQRDSPSLRCRREFPAQSHLFEWQACEVRRTPRTPRTPGTKTITTIKF